MKLSVSRVFQGWSLGLALLALAPAMADQAPNLPRKSDMTELSSRLQATFAQTRTVCFGRFVITVPVRTKVVFGRMTVGAEIFFGANKSGEIDQFIERQRIKIEEQLDRRDERVMAPDAVFGKVLDGAVPGHKMLLGLNSNGYQLFSFVPLSTGLFIFESRGFMAVEPKQRMAEHNRVARALRPRTDDEIPTGKGVCLEGGFVDHDDEFENTWIGFRLEDFPDVHLSLDLMKNREFVLPQTDFEHDLKYAEKSGREEGLGAWWDSIQYLRRGKRSLLEWQGEEVAAWKPARAGFHEASHEFIFWSPGRAHDPFHPQFRAQFHTGVKGNKRAAAVPSVTNEEATALWDKLLGSIRVRPADPVAADRPEIAPGASVKAGVSCPTAGWWECQDAQYYGAKVAMKGSAVRYFREGNAMPQAVLQKQGWWQRMTGTGEIFQSTIPSQWRLLDRRIQQRPPETGVTPATTTEQTTPAPSGGNAVASRD